MNDLRIKSRRWDSNPHATAYETVALPLSLVGKTSERRDSNPRPLDWQTSAQPSVLHSQSAATKFIETETCYRCSPNSIRRIFKQAVGVGFEPTRRLLNRQVLCHLATPHQITPCRRSSGSSVSHSTSRHGCHVQPDDCPVQPPLATQSMNRERFELSTSCLRGRHSLQLSYRSKQSSGDGGTRTLDLNIDSVAATPSGPRPPKCTRMDLNHQPHGYQPCALPLSYRCLCQSWQGRIRTCKFQFQRLTCCRLHYLPKRANSRNRTGDDLIHRQALLPTELCSPHTPGGIRTRITR